jgi:hypothetical protein
VLRVETLSQRKQGQAEKVPARERRSEAMEATLVAEGW